MKFRKGLHALSNVMAWTSGGLVFLMALLTFVNVFARRVLNAPLTGAQELSELAMAIILYFGLPFAVYSRKMIVVDAFTTRLKKVSRETLAGVCDLMCLIMSGVFAWKLIETGLKMLSRGTYTSVLEIPYWPFYLLCAFANIVLFAEQIADAVRWFRQAKGKEEAE